MINQHMKHQLLAMLTWVILASRLFAAAPGPTQFFVAPNGKDADPGTKERPFATPTRAMEAVRALVADGLKNDLCVVLRGGTYPLAAPLVFTSADSGSAAHSVTYAAAAGEAVVISGGRPIANWKPAGVQDIAAGPP